jgi:hypothetical protein
MAINVFLNCFEAGKNMALKDSLRKKSDFIFVENLNEANLVIVDDYLTVLGAARRENILCVYLTDVRGFNELPKNVEVISFVEFIDMTTDLDYFIQEDRSI